MKITRRKLAGAVLLPAAVRAQAPAPRAPDEELAAARDQNRHASEALRKVDLPMSTEPAFVFKA